MRSERVEAPPFGLSFLIRMKALALHMLWPVSCPVCGRLGEVLCGGCLAALLSPTHERCLLCGEEAPCLLHPGAPVVRSAAAYEVANPVILALKYGGLRALGPRLGEGMAKLWPRPDVDLLIPTPLHHGSTRGYNQALEIAKGLGRVWKLPVREVAQWALDLPSRAGLGREERMALQPEAFAVSPEVRGLRVLLVDDVCTTGATLARLASACEAQGAWVDGAYVAAGTLSARQ